MFSYDENSCCERFSSNHVFKTIFVHSPLTILLKCSSKAIDSNKNPVEYDGIEDDVEWILNGEANFTDQFDSYITNLISWNVYSLFAEVCLHLAKLLRVDDERQHALINEGLRFSSLADPKMKDIDGNVTNPVAFESHSRIYIELKQFNASNV